MSLFLADVQTFQQVAPPTQEVDDMMGNSCAATVTDIVKFTCDEAYQFCVRYVLLYCKHGADSGLLPLGYVIVTTPIKSYSISMNFYSISRASRS